jgi:complex iron-sulfur molybdoenzyme family reductase subunit gamma
MKAVKLQLATRTLLNPGAVQWDKVPVEEVRLAGMPVHLQPSRYIRTVWADRAVGAVRFLSVKAAHNSRDIIFRLEWADETENRDYANGSAFPDAAAVIFPLNGDAPLETMGSPKAPVNAWHWRANFEEDAAENLVSRGLGTEEATGNGSLKARAKWSDGRWRVIFVRPLTVGERQTVRFKSGKPVKVAFAVWEGSNQERANLNAYSKEWRDLIVE